MRYFLVILFSFLGLLAYIVFLIEEAFPGFQEGLSFSLVFLFWVGVQAVLMRLLSKNWVTAGGCLTLLVENVVFMILFSVFSTGWEVALARPKNGPVTKSDWAEAGYNLPQYVAVLPSVKIVSGSKGTRGEAVREILYVAGVSGIDVSYTLNFGAYRNNGGSVNLSETARGETVVVIYVDDLSPPTWTANQKAQYLTFLGGCRRADWGKSAPQSNAECESQAKQFVESKNAKAEKFKILP